MGYFGPRGWLSNEIYEEHALNVGQITGGLTTRTRISPPSREHGGTIVLTVLL